MQNDSDAVEFFDHYSPAVAALARQARALILEVMPAAVEQIDPSANLIAYGQDRTYRGLICGITLHTNHINLMFARGASLPDPHGLLTGSGKKARHIRVEQAADLERPGVRLLLETALFAARES